MSLFIHLNKPPKNWTQTGKRIYIRALSQKNEGSVEIKQETN
jgi:hypothetical protein